MLPRVAPEVRIYYYIERYYGVARPARFVKFGDTPRGDETIGDAGPARAAAAGSAAGARRARHGARSDARGCAARSWPRCSTRASRSSSRPTICSRRSTPTTPRPPSRAPHVRPHRTTTPPPIDAADGLAERRDAISADRCDRRARALTERNRIIEVLLGYASRRVPSRACCSPCAISSAFGWKAFGDVPGRAHVEHLLIPLDAPSIVQAATAAENGVFHGAPTPSTVNTYLYKVLGTRRAARTRPPA